MVRHQLSLHGAGTAERPNVRAGLAQADRGIRGSQSARVFGAPGADRARYVFKTRQECGGWLRPAVAAGPAAAGLHRSLARTRSTRRGMGAARRTLPRA